MILRTSAGRPNGARAPEPSWALLFCHIYIYKYLSKRKRGRLKRALGPTLLPRHLFGLSLCFFFERREGPRTPLGPQRTPRPWGRPSDFFVKTYCIFRFPIGGPLGPSLFNKDIISKKEDGPRGSQDPRGPSLEQKIKIMCCCFLFRSFL